MTATHAGVRRRADAAELSPANVNPGWAQGKEWRTWESPRAVIAGESHRQPALQKLAGMKKPRTNGYLVPVEVWLIRERENRYDRNAFRAEVNGRHIGYLRREIASQVAKPLDAARCSRFAVCGVLRGGCEDGSFLGCHVWLDRRTVPGPDFSFRDDSWTVSWPPGLSEGSG
jgi:hypothetical protein